MKTPIVSIIIPCYNHGKYLLETIASIEKHPNPEVYEIIIVNDGSTDEETLKIMTDLEKKHRVIHQENLRQNKSRNNAIRVANGKYILPVDSDNTIDFKYIDKSIKILNENSEIGVVYSDSCFFGEKEGENLVPDWDLRRQFFVNYVDNCAVYRRKIWEELGGYDENMPLQGALEDWEFWLSASVKGWKFHHIPEVLFHYRVRDFSASTIAQKPKNRDIQINYMNIKHIERFREEFKTLYYDKIHQEKYCDSVVNSIDFRIGRLILKPFRFIKKILKI